MGIVLGLGLVVVGGVFTYAVVQLEKEVNKQLDIRDDMLLQLDMRLMEIELGDVVAEEAAVFALRKAPVEVQEELQRVITYSMEFNFLKGRIESGRYTKAYLYKVIDTYRRAKRITEEEYEVLYNMI